MAENNQTDLKYTKTHEWLQFEGNQVTCGITAHALEILGDVKELELPAAGTRVKKGTKLVSLESAKAVSDIYAPLDGEISAVNTPLQADPGLLNQDPLAGWLFKLQFEGDPPAGLMDAAGYAGFIRE